MTGSHFLKVFSFPAAGPLRVVFCFANAMQKCPAGGTADVGTCTDPQEW